VIVNVRPRTLRRRLILIGFGGLVAAGMLTLPPQAHADPTVGEVALKNAAGICALLNTDPTFAGVDEVAARLLAQGWTGSTTGLVMIAAVDNVCPRHTELLLAWAKQYTQPAPGFIA
jgi:hypothetical protein